MNTQNKMIEILLATYNGAKYIEELLESIKKQTNQNIALLIRDDGSTDDTVDIVNRILASWNRPWKWITTKTNTQGPVSNFIELMAHATADYILFADQDDYWLPNKIEKTFTRMRELEKTYGRNVPLLVHTDLHVVDATLKSIDPSLWNYSQLNPTRNHLNHLLIQNVITGCTVMINRCLLDLSLPICKEKIIMHDWWIGLVATTFGRIGIIKEVTILYRQHEKNQVGAQRSTIELRDILTKFRTVPRDITRPFSQAQSFYDQYATRLSPSQRQLVEAFATIPHQSYLAKRMQLTRYRCFKHPWIRNLGLFWHV